MQNNYPPRFTYQEFARDFTAELFDPHKWMALFEKSGAKYVILTAKHLDGYTLWPSNYSFSWNSKDVGPDRDLLGEFTNAVRNTSMKFGLYYTLFEWYHPQYMSDKKSKFTKNDFVLHKVLPEMMEMVNLYQPDILWSGGDWQANDTYWKSKEFLAWLYNESPVKDTVLVNDGWGNGTECRHGGYFVCSNLSAIKNHKWEKAVKMDKLSWGYRRNVNYEDFQTVKELILILAQTVSRGGNLLLNVGPTSDGRIDLLSSPTRKMVICKW
ncbi:hypothetical protein RI129_006466 [Pyrocoelia pectoralis]|uniref:alpha-L-fucosidase n=1 Tax=Pyrocoelia pectoralis TaxID=417401 RepID=A0AAN7VH95_9COLE